MIAVYQAQNFTSAFPLHEKNEKKWSNDENIGDTLNLSLKCLVLHAVTNT